MINKSQISWLLIALVCAASSHCVISHATESVALHQQLRFDDQPLDNTRATCENESSCICKGATLAAVTIVPTVDWNPVDTVQVDANATVQHILADSLKRDFAEERCSIPNTGKVLRAHLQSFLL